MNSRAVHPWLFLVLMIPFGAASGYAATVLGYLLKRGGVSGLEIGSLLALGTLPHTWKFIWSPVVDLTLSPKKWYAISTLLTALALGMFGAFPESSRSLGALSVFVFLGGCATSFIGMAVDSLMAHCTPEEAKGRAGGWCQAGNLGGSGLGGGLGLLLALHWPEHWMASALIAGICALCCLALGGMPSPPREIRGDTVGQLIMAVLRDTWGVVRVRRGMLALLLCIVPLGIGASSALWSAMGSEWGASGETIAVVTGVMGGLVSATGCLAGGFLCDRWNRQSCYVGFGLLVAAAGALMGAAPRTPVMFTVFTLSMSFAAGMSWAGYTAFVLEAIGRGAAATKFTAFASIANVPIFYMQVVNGWALSKWGSAGMLYFEAALGGLGALIFLLAAWLLLREARKMPAV